MRRVRFLEVFGLFNKRSAQQKYYLVVISLLCFNLTLWSISWSTFDSAQQQKANHSSNRVHNATTSNRSQSAVYTRIASACLRNRAVVGSIGKSALSDSHPKCADMLQRAIPAVSCEVFSAFSSNFASLESLLRFDGACKPRSFQYPCSTLDDSPLRCAHKGVQIRVYDYHKQHHCLSQLADKVHASESEGESEGEGDRVPRILHYVWYYKHEEPLEFLHYLGLISTLRFFEPKAVFIWYDYSLPTGRWWSELLKQVYPADAKLDSERVNASYDGRYIEREVEFFRKTQIYAVYRKRPAQVYNSAIKLDAHRSDIVRIEALLNYGGLYIDTDVLAIQPMDQYLRYAAVFPKEPSATLSNSIIFAERQAAYLYLWHHTYTTFQANEWTEHSTVGNFALSRMCPHLLRTESDSLMKPVSADLFLKSYKLLSKRMFHLYWNWKANDLPAENFRELRSAVDVLDWDCTIGNIVRAIFLGTCGSICA